MENFKQFRRTQIAEMRPVTEADIVLIKYQKFIHISGFPVGYNVSISDADKNNGSPKIGDMIARNPNDYLDQWLVAEQYFKDNFETLKEVSNERFYEIDFEGSLLTQIKVSGSEIEIIRSVNGYGNAIKNPRVSEGKNKNFV